MSTTTPYTEAWLSGPQQTRFYTRTYKPEDQQTKAAVVFVHGFAEHIGRYEHVLPAWSARGIAVLAFDQRGFGRTALDLENKSKTSSYGKTSWKEQLEDIEWAVKHVKNEFGAMPVFLYGHSMGGGLVLAFPTRETAPPSPDTVSSLAGVIATSPLILQTKPAPRVARWLGDKASRVFPSVLIPAPVNAKDLSHDQAVNEAYLKDPLVKQVGSLKGISDMLDGGENLLRKDYAHWPENLPVRRFKLLFYSRMARKTRSEGFISSHFPVPELGWQITSHKASEQFYNAVPAQVKHLSIYPGGFHELHNEPNGVKERLINECITWAERHIPSPAQYKL
ncbi:alpha beta-hydrolase [Pisolithus marmoratus]|nr:alpha beta-hydrolase [Pisolithus marmoratus]